MCTKFGSKSGVVVKLLACWSWSGQCLTTTTISEIIYPLLRSRDITEITWKRRKILLESNPNIQNSNINVLYFGTENFARILWKSNGILSSIINFKVNENPCNVVELNCVSSATSFHHPLVWTIIRGSVPLLSETSSTKHVGLSITINSNYMDEIESGWWILGL